MKKNKELIIEESVSLLFETKYIHKNNIDKKEVLIVSENIRGNEYTVIKNVLLQVGDIKNKNNRVYVWQELVKAVNEYINTRCIEEAGYGELGHTDMSHIDPSRVSHSVRNIIFDGINNRIYGDIVILDFLPFGKMLKDYVSRKLLLGISSRALGVVNEKKDKGEYYEITDIDIVGWDIVCVPSVHGAYLQNVNIESKKIDRKQIIKDIDFEKYL